MLNLCKQQPYQSDVAKQTFRVEPGTFTDFCCVPRVPIAYDMLGNRFPRAGAVHDDLYRRRQVTRQLAGAVLCEMLLLEGATHTEAMACYLAVRRFGGSHWGRIGKRSRAPDRHFASMLFECLHPWLKVWMQNRWIGMDLNSSL